METKLNPITCGRPWGARERREKYSEGLRGAVNSFKKLFGFGSVMGRVGLTCKNGSTYFCFE